MPRYDMSKLTHEYVCDITYATPRETLLSTPEALPTSEPSTPQISYTIQSSDLPTFSLQPASFKYACVVIGAGRFVTAGTLYWRVLRNGVSQFTSSGSVSANTYYSFHGRVYNVSAGDTIAIKLWSSVSDSNWDYQALYIHPSRPIFRIEGGTKILRNVYVTVDSLPNLTLGNPSKISRGDLMFYLEELRIGYYSGSYPFTKYFPILQMGDTYGVFQISQGDYISGAGTVRTHASYRPAYEWNVSPTTLRFRGIKV